MDSTELEKTLGDLEEKMERTRALYEQYFVGIEKLEPQIPRKDVDRVIATLRKVQIRNTALRFKFQTLIQRYNTMQQHWHRILREIENGTFKRDLLKAAARFGVDDALTAVGRKHAARLKGAIEKKGKQGKRAVQEEEIYEELSSSDLDELAEDVDEEDDAPTPPPQAVPRGGARQQVYDITAEPEAAPPYAQLERQGAPSFQIEDPLAGTDSIPPPPGPRDGFAATAEAPAYAAPAPAQKKGGLRWGGSGMRKADPEALKRLANLAGGSAEGGEKAEAQKREMPKTTELEPMRKPLLSAPLDLGLPDDSVDEPPKPAPPPKAAEPARKPLLSAPLDLDLGLSPSEPPPPPAPAAAAKAAPEPEPSSKDNAAAERARRLELQRPKPGLRPPPAEGSSSAKREFGDLNDGRLRELYGQYVQAKRERNESTAGITYEKLADSLKSQAGKLRDKHGKRVDYEVVVKDGKTLIKPIVK